VGQIQLQAMPLVNNERLQMLNCRGWLCIVLAGINLLMAGFLAYHGSWWSVFSLFISFLMWLGIYDPRNLKQSNNNEQSNK